MLQEQLTQVLDSLADRERKVIELRFGLVDGHPRTLEEVGREFGVTRSVSARSSPRPWQAPPSEPL